MSYQASTDLDLIAESQHSKEDTANAVLAALASAGLYGIKRSATSGLNFTLYGGVILIAGEPTVIANQTIVLTASATNYIYATAAGVVTKTTSIPSGWPGPLAADAMALYVLVVGTTSITSGDSFVLSLGRQGDAGDAGAQGPSGSTFFDNQKRILQHYGAGYHQYNIAPFTFSSGTTNRAPTGASFLQSIPYMAFVTNTSAGDSVFAVCNRNMFYLGNATGWGGFTVSIRFMLESAFAATNGRCFFGIMPKRTSNPGNVEPDTFTDIIGVGAKMGQANLSIMHNDSSGIATMTTIVSDDSPGVNFPAKAADKVYELTLTTEPNSQTVSWELLDCETQVVATGSVGSNIPSNTTFLSVGVWANNGTGGTAHCFGLAQIVVETPN